jgi:hypothetical protein
MIAAELYAADRVKLRRRATRSEMEERARFRQEQGERRY